MSSGTFGELIRKRRLEKEQTLRNFCKTFKYDAAYISRLENNILLPPKKLAKLKKLAKALDIAPKTEEWKEFLGLADISRRQIPQEIDQRVVDYLPAFFRKASKKKVTTKDVERLIQLIKGG